MLSDGGSRAAAGEQTAAAGAGAGASAGGRAASPRGLCAALIAGCGGQRFIGGPRPGDSSSLPGLCRASAALCVYREDAQPGSPQMTHDNLYPLR